VQPVRLLCAPLYVERIETAMDRHYVQDHQIVERYLSGDLTVREARQFEKYCLEHPDVLQEMPIPVRLKARLSRQPLDHSETAMFETIPSSATIAAADRLENGDDDDELHAARYGRGTSKGLMYSLFAVVIALAAGTVIYGLRARALAEEVQQLKQLQRKSTLQAPSAVQTFNVPLNRAGVPADATIALGWSEAAQLLEISVDTNGLNYTQYQVTIEKADEARLMVMRRLARDSNREVRLALNSSAFGPGAYILKFEGYTWRGQLEPAGWLKIEMR
jgi:hypothetical protein